MKLTRISSVYIKYLLFYISIVLLSCMFIGLGLLLMSVSELNRVMVAEQKSKLKLAAADLSNQYAVLEDIARKIKVSIYYQPYFLEHNKYNEIELIKDFSKYIGYSPLTSEYFLFYPDSQYLFTPQSRSLAIVYLEDVLGIPASKTLLEKVSTVSSSCIIPAGTGHYLAVFPLNMVRFSSSRYDALLCFVVTEKSILNRCRTVSAGFNSDIYVFFDDKPLVNLLPNGDNGTITISSGRFDIKMNVSSGKLYTQMNGFTRMSVIIIVIITLLLLSMAILAAYLSYSPIKKLTQRYLSTEAQGKNELECIESILAKEIISQKQRAALVKQLSEQRTLIRQQMIILLLSGQYNSEIDLQMREVGILLDGESFCALTISIPSQESASNLMSLIEELSDEKTQYYSAHLKARDHLAVVVSTQSISDISNAEELIRELGDTIGVNLKISSGFVCKDPRQLQSSLLIALSKEQMKPGDIISFQKEIQIGNRNWYNDTDLNKMIEAIEHNQDEKALFHLKLFATTIDREYSSLLIRRYIYIDAVNAVMRKVREWGASIDSKKISNLFLLESTDAFINEMSTIISGLCIEESNDNNSNIDKRNASIMSYIDTHYTDYEISLDKIADEFNLSNKQVSRIVKDKTGRLFKEYLTMLKIEKAKNLLTEGVMTISQVSECLNYSSISYFIKTFKEVTGYTPANYKKFIQ